MKKDTHNKINFCWCMVLIELVEIKKDEHEGLKNSEWAKFVRAL